jgi:glycosyltransferase involved in cell wall biosynthesis
MVRAMVYKDELKKRGIQASFFKLNSQFLTNLIKLISFYPINFFLRVLKKIYFLFRRYFLLSNLSQYDVIIAVKFIDSTILQQIKHKSKALLVYDFDDAVWLDMFFGEEEFSKKISISDCITSDNIYLANYANKYNKNSYVVNGPCQVEKFSLLENSFESLVKKDNEIVLGWIGSPYTLFYLYKIYDALEAIGDKYPNVILKLIGTGDNLLLVPPFEKIKIKIVPSYNQFQMIEQVYSFDIGLYPLFLNELSLGRGALKATIYMSGKIPFVASSIGEVKELIKDGTNGFLANNNEEWINKLSLLIESSKLRNNMGARGFDLVNQNYTIESCSNQFINIVEKQLSFRSSK